MADLDEIPPPSPPIRIADQPLATPPVVPTTLGIGDCEITILYKLVDANGNVIGETSVTVSLADPLLPDIRRTTLIDFVTNEAAVAGLIA